MSRPVLDYWTDPALWLDDDFEPAPAPPPAEVLTVSAGVVWWTAAEDDEDLI
jgi:hypothetical protein